MSVLVFKTDINSAQRVHRARPRLVACQLCQLRGVCRWSIDLEDCDHVLRIEADNLDEPTVVRALTSAGLHCKALAERSEH